MDNQRLLIWVFFAMMLWFTYQAWQRDYGPQPSLETVQPSDILPTAQDDAFALPEVTAPADGVPDLPAPPAQDATAAAPEAGTIHVRTDVFDIDISLAGGTVVGAALPRFPVHKDQPDVPVVLLSTDPANFGLIRTGLRAADGDRPAPGHTAIFSARQADYELGAADELVVPMTWTDGQGLALEKRFVFHRGSYAIDVEQTLTNNSDATWTGDEYSQLLRRFHDRKRTMFDVDTYSFDGPIIYDGERAEKLKRPDLLEEGPYQFTTDNGWVASIQHHFLSAIIPSRGAPHIFQVRVDGEQSTASVVGAKQTVAPGEAHTFTRTLFVGPKLQTQLEDIDKTLKLTVDYGWLTILSQPLFWLLSKAHALFANWGLAIISVTILIKLVFYKLTESSGRSMAKMRKLQPRLKAIQERYKDDRQQQSQAMMDLYKREKVNPAAGCLPILIQMPFFLAFYWVLLESVEMRQAPFALWITDLSSRDPYFILPLIMGAAMFFQQRLNPQVGDPVQMKVMQVMPLIFTAMFAFFPAGLVLYWVTNTILSIAQQWKINRVVEREDKQPRGGKRPKKGEEQG